MRKIFPKFLDQYRVQLPGYEHSEDGQFEGAYIIPIKNKKLKVVCGVGGGWDHVSVSLFHRIATWAEMCFVKKMFFADDELVIQFHPPKNRYINYHKHVLHLWRPWDQVIELPPDWMLAPMKR